jgi:hypothetical protein
VTERKIQTEAYWRDEFTVSDQDLEHIGVLFLELERPLTLSDLAQLLIRDYCRREEDLIRRQLSQGTMYRPNGSFAIGEKVVFPQRDFAVGSVVGMREGHNPEYGEFQVVTVEFEGDAHSSLYAAELKVPHRLTLPQGGSLEGAFSLTPDDLIARYGEIVVAELGRRLESGSAFVSFRGQWLPRDMLADIHVGHLNIAEAVVDIGDRPLPSEDLLADLDLPAEIPQPIRMFSLNCALSGDERFDDVGDDRQVLWSLRRWEPPALFTSLDRLSYEPLVYDRTGLDVTHLQLEREIDDEASELIAPPAIGSARSLTLLLAYPHWRTGTLPLTERTRSFFPSGHVEQHTLITLVDRANRSEFPGWVVHGESFVYGLADWYQANNVPVGAYLKLERMDDPGRIAIDYIPRRMQREWVRMVVEGDAGELTFQMQKRPIACEYDELYVMDEVDREATDRLWTREQEGSHSLDDLVRAVFLELTKLSPSGMVHSKTLYNAVNVVNRCPPGPLFAALFKQPEFVTTGDGYWLYQGRHDGL